MPNSQHDERSWRLHNARGVLNSLPCLLGAVVASPLGSTSVHHMNFTAPRKTKPTNHDTKAPRPSPNAPSPEIHLTIHSTVPNSHKLQAPQKRQNANPQTTESEHPEPSKKKCPPSASASASPLAPIPQSQPQSLLPLPAPRPSPFPRRRCDSSCKKQHPSQPSSPPQPPAWQSCNTCPTLRRKPASCGGLFGGKRGRRWGRWRGSWGSVGSFARLLLEGRWSWG